MKAAVFDADGALSKEFLLERGHCCKSGCRNCPYGFNQKPRVLLSWSSGKDAAWALHQLQDKVDVVGLFTTINEEFDRVAMHGVRRELVETQAAVAGLPLLIANLPWPCSNAQYEQAVSATLEEARNRWRITHVAFGDLFLTDVRVYREDQLARHAGLSALFPLWDIPTGDLAAEMIKEGLKARIVCVDPKQLSPTFLGREYDAQLLAELPPDVDPCGERGEFHTFAYEGPMFSFTLGVRLGEFVERDGFHYADLTLGP